MCVGSVIGYLVAIAIGARRGAEEERFAAVLVVVGTTQPLPPRARCCRNGSIAESSWSSSSSPSSSAAAAKERLRAPRLRFRASCSSRAARSLRFATRASLTPSRRTSRDQTFARTLAMLRVWRRCSRRCTTVAPADARRTASEHAYSHTESREGVAPVLSSASWTQAKGAMRIISLLIILKIIYLFYFLLNNICFFSLLVESLSERRSQSIRKEEWAPVNQRERHWKSTR